MIERARTRHELARLGMRTIFLVILDTTTICWSETFRRTSKKFKKSFILTVQFTGPSKNYFSAMYHMMGTYF